MFKLITFLFWSSAIDIFDARFEKKNNENNNFEIKEKKKKR